MIKPLFYIAVLSAITAVCVAWNCIAFGRYGTVFNMAVAWLVGCVVAIIGMLRQASRKPDKLREAGLQAYERHGFSFGIGIAEMFGRPCLILIYQNRYERPCVADIVLRPTAKTVKHGFKVIQLAVHCEGGGDGQEMAWLPSPNNIPDRLARFEIAAHVHYREGRGRLVRWQKGRPISSLQSLEELSDVKLVTLAIPLVKVTESEGTISPSSTAEGTLPGDSAPASPAATAEETLIGSSVGTERDSSFAWATVPGQEDLTTDHLCALLEHLNQDGARARHRRFIQETRFRAAAAPMGIALACMLGAGLLLSMGVPGLQQSEVHPMAVAFVVVGSMAAAIGLRIWPWWYFSSGTSLPGQHASTPEEALQGLLELTLRPRFNRRVWWVIGARFVADAAVAVFRDEPEAAEALTRRWERLRESLVASTSVVVIGRVQILPHLALGEGVVRLSVEVRCGSTTMVVRNAALRVGADWFLATLEPLTDVLEREQSLILSALSAVQGAPVPKLKPPCEVHAVPGAPVRTARHRKSVTFPLGANQGLEEDFDRKKVQLCTLDDYRRAVAALPPPTDAQIENYVAYVSEAHSWHKKLPALPPGFPFVFYFDPGAGYRSVLQAGGRVRLEEILPDDPTDHYSQRTTAFYHENFGRLRYAVFGTWPTVSAMEHAPDPILFPIFSADRTAYRVPWEVVCVSLVGVTSAVSVSRWYPLNVQQQHCPEGFNPDPHDPPSWQRLRELARAQENPNRIGWNHPEWQQLMEGERLRVRAEMALAIKRLRWLIYAR